MFRRSSNDIRYRPNRIKSEMAKSSQSCSEIFRHPHGLLSRHDSLHNPEDQKGVFLGRHSSLDGDNQEIMLVDKVE